MNEALDKAMQSFKAGKLKQALGEYQAIVAMDPQNALAFQGLGDTYARLRRDVEAIIAYRKALQLEPGLAKSHANLGAIYLNRREFAEGEKETRLALELDPKLVEAHINLGNILALQGRLEEGEAALKRAIDLDPTRSFTYCALVENHLRQRQFRDAKEITSRVLHISPTCHTLSQIVFAITGAYSQIVIFLLLLLIIIALNVQPILGLLVGITFVVWVTWGGIKVFRLGARRRATIILAFAALLLWGFVSVFLNVRK